MILDFSLYNTLKSNQIIKLNKSNFGDIEKGLMNELYRKSPRKDLTFWCDFDDEQKVIHIGGLYHVSEGEVIQWLKPILWDYMAMTMENKITRIYNEMIVEVKMVY